MNLSDAITSIHAIAWLQDRIKTTIIVFLFCLISTATFLILKHLGYFEMYKTVLAGLILGSCATFAILLVLICDFFRVRWWRLHRLAGDEREVLSYFVVPDKTTIHLFATDDKPKSLANEGILKKELHGGNGEGFIWYTLTPWIFRYLRARPNLLK
jgi:hypothetical protein